MKSLRTVLILAVVAFGLLAYIVFYESTTPSTDEAREAQGQLFDIDQNKLHRLEITNPKGRVVIEKIDDRWRIIEPVSAPVAGGTLTQILNWLEFGRSTREIDYKVIQEDGIQTLRRFGLVPPEIRIDFRGPDVGQHTLLVGRQVAATPNAYAKTTDKKEATIRLVPLEVRELLSLGLNELRGRRVFDLDQTLVTGASVGLPDGGAVEVSRTGDRAWQMRKPIVSRADHKATLEWIGSVMRLLVADYISDESANLTTYGLASPRGRITLVHGPSGREHTLLIGSDVPDDPTKIYAKLLDNPTIFTLEKKDALELTTSLSETRDRQLAPIDLDRITAVKLAQADGPNFDVTATPTGWDITGVDQPANGTAVFDLLNAIAALKVERFVKDAAADLAPYGLDEPSAVIQLTAAPAAEGRPSTDLVIKLGKVEDGLLYASTSEAPFIVAIPTRILQRLPYRDWDWRGLRVGGTHLDDVKSVEIATDKGVKATLERQGNGTYTTDLPGHAVDAVTADQQAALLSRLRGLRWLGPVKPEHGLDTPVLRYTLRTENGEPFVLLVGKELPSIGRAAIVEGDDTVFELAPEDYKTLSAMPLVRENTAGPSSKAPAIPDMP